MTNPHFKIGRFSVLRQLGEGGMGEVYLAEDEQLQRKVAIKVLPRGVDSPQMHSRFVREAQSAAKINHPHVVTIFEVGKHDGRTYIALEWMESGSLQDSLDKVGRLNWRDATRLIAQACRGLQSAHDNGILHRDIKPANILLSSDGNAKLGDFGLARWSDSSMTALTKVGQVVGTPLYMSPQQCRSEEIDIRSDLYSLGATYFTLLTGRPPYDGELPVQVAFAHCSAPVPDPRSINPVVPAACAAITMKAMAKQPQDRYQTAVEMVAALENALRLTETVATSAAPNQSKSKVVVVTAVAVGVLVLSAPAWWMLSRREAATQPHAGATPTSTAVAPAPADAPFGTPGNVGGMAMTKDASRLAAALADGEGGVMIWNMPDGEPVGHHWRGNNMRALAWSPDGQYLAAGDLGGHGVRLLKVSDGAEYPLDEKEVQAGVRALVYLPDGRLVVGLGFWGESSGQSVRVYDTASGKFRELGGCTAAVWTLSCTDDGSLIAGSSSDGKGFLWKGDDGSLVHQFDIGKKEVSPSMMISPDGKLLVTAGAGMVNGYVGGKWDESAWQWQPANGGEVWSLAMDREQRWLLAAAENVCAFDLRVQRPVKPKVTITTPCVIQSPAGGFFAAAVSEGGRKRVRLLKPEELFTAP